jgi:hypothetical protein
MASTKDPTIKIAISAASYNEIAAALEKKGYKLDLNVGIIQLEKNVELEHPIDYRLATIRRDCATVAARAWSYANGTNNFVSFVDEIFQYVLNGMPEPITKEWK